MLAHDAGSQAEDRDDSDAQRVALPRQLRALDCQIRGFPHSACTTASTSAPSDSRAKLAATSSGIRDGVRLSPRAMAASFARQRVYELVATAAPIRINGIASNSRAVFPVSRNCSIARPPPISASAV